MLYLFISMGLLFVVIGFIVTKNNAKYLLSGYNTMTEAEQKRFDLDAFLRFFRKFHLFLGLSFLGIGIAIERYFGNIFSGIFLAAYPILCYIYFLFASMKFSDLAASKKNKIGIYILALTLLIVVGMLIYESQESEFSIQNNKILIEGSYGESIDFDEIKNIQLIHELPKLTMKTNGFDLGDIKKGYFKTAQGEIVKLIIHRKTEDYILIEKLNGEKIYYASESKNHQIILSEMGEMRTN